jgi:nitroreductase
MNYILGILKKIIPDVLRRRLRLGVDYIAFITNYARDAKRFIKYSAFRDFPRSRTHLRALITMDYHGIEKGLSLANPRGWFGQVLIERLTANLEKYIQAYGRDDLTTIAGDSLSSYYKFSFGAEGGSRKSGGDFRVGEPTKAAYRGPGDLECLGDAGGVQMVEKNRIINAARIDFEAFVKSRHSVRHFSQEPVDANLIKKAVEMAIFTPSVCNRQAWRVYGIYDNVLKAISLELQRGNRGFTDQISKVLIVTCDLENFSSVGERNQAWVDGGMFAMSLVYALHAEGLGTCCLNWCKTQQTDVALRRAIGLPDNEVVIMMLAVGNLPDRFNVALSKRRSLDEVLFDDWGIGPKAG